MRILITRPREDAEGVAKILRDLGHEPVIAPLLEIKYLSRPPLNLDHVQALAMTSANGVRAFALRSDERQIPVFSIGDATTRAARAAGFEDVWTADGDVGGLGALLGGSLKAGAGTVLHAAGTALAGDLAGIIEASGLKYRREILYEARKAARLGDKVEEQISAGQINAALIYSPRTGAAFVQLLEVAGLAKSTPSMTVYCLSPAVTDAVSNLSWAAVKTAPAPTQAALIDLIE